MTTQVFKTGDVVELKSGGPAMTVDVSTDQFTRCYWYNEETARIGHEELPTGVLQLVSELPKKPMRTDLPDEFEDG